MICSDLKIPNLYNFLIFVSICSLDFRFCSKDFRLDCLLSVFNPFIHVGVRNLRNKSGIAQGYVKLMFECGIPANMTSWIFI